jgi:hypothetical protein
LNYTEIKLRFLKIPPFQQLPNRDEPMKSLFIKMHKIISGIEISKAVQKEIKDKISSYQNVRSQILEGQSGRDPTGMQT